MTGNDGKIEFYGGFRSMRKQLTFGDATTGFTAK